MTAIVEHIMELPWALAFVVLWAVVVFRSNLVYAVGRGISAGTGKSRFAYLLDTPMYRKGEQMTARWGIYAVPLSFATIGLQSMVLIGAGVARMPLPRFELALAVGGIIWASIYSTVGMAIFHAWLTHGGMGALAAVAAVVAVIVWLKRRAQNPA